MATLLAVSRESFDGMRGYHASELAHKKDVLDILRGALSGTIVVYGAALAAIYVLAYEQDQPQGLVIIFIGALSFAVTIVFLFLLRSIVRGTIEKIQADGAAYDRFYQTWQKANDALGLNTELVHPKVLGPIRTVERIEKTDVRQSLLRTYFCGSRRGRAQTSRIIIDSFLFVSVLALAGAMIVLVFAIRVSLSLD